MLILGILVGLLLGLVAGGSLSNLASIRLRWLGLLLAAIALRFGTDILLNANVAIVELLRLPLLAAAFSMLLVGLWANREYPGLGLAFVGVLSNTAVIIINGGYMPIYEPSLAAAGFTEADVSSAIHVVLPEGLNAAFLLRLGPLGDVIPIPLPIIQNVISIGDVFLSVGLAFFLFASVLRTPEDLDEASEAAIQRRIDRIAAGIPAVAGGETGYPAAFADAAALERPIMLGGSRPGLSSPSLGPMVEFGEGGVVPLRPDAGVAGRDPRPSICPARPQWLILRALGRPADLAVRRPDPPTGHRRDGLHRDWLAARDGLRVPFGGPAEPVPVAVRRDIRRPLGQTRGPRRERHPAGGGDPAHPARRDHEHPARLSAELHGHGDLRLLPTGPDRDPPAAGRGRRTHHGQRRLMARRDDRRRRRVRLGRPARGRPRDSVAPRVLAGFATYLASAILLATLVVRPAESTEATDADEIPAVGFFAEMRAGWDFLRHETVLLANTLQATVGQFTLGILIALTVIYANDVFAAERVGPTAVWGFIETAIGLGNLVGGFIIGLIGARLAKGRMVIAGYAIWGLMVFFFAITDHLWLALGLSFGQGITNMIFVIPSQTLFQQRTPAELMGRVVGFRFSLVFGSMAIAMGVGGLLAQVLPVTTVIAAFGLVTTGAGLAGLLVPAVRDA